MAHRLLMSEDIKNHSPSTILKSSSNRVREVYEMKKKTVTLFSLLSIFGLIGTASADWIVQAIATPPPMPEQAGLIILGASMVALAVVGRNRLSHTKPQINAE